MMDLAILILRLGLGVMFLAHGSQKVFGAFGGPGIEGFSKMVAGLGFKPVLFWTFLAAYTELLGGLFLVAGFLTRIAALFLLVFMLIAVLKVHLAKGFFMSHGGFEYNWVIICVCLALIILGTGKFGLTKKF
jgi:putative oxidoreductase